MKRKYIFKISLNFVNVTLGPPDASLISPVAVKLKEN